MIPKNNKPLVVVLEEESQSMEEVVVTGYFTKSKSSYTGSAVTVKAEELKKINPTNIRYLAPFKCKSSMGKLEFNLSFNNNLSNTSKITNK